MNVDEAALIYPLAEQLPEAGSKLQVAPDVYWVRMPLPFALDHINLWLLRDCIEGQHGWTVIDTGISNDTIKALWEVIFDQHLEGLPILRVVVTHCHPDHFGLAWWITQGGNLARWQAPLWMSMGEYLAGRVLNGNRVAGEPTMRSSHQSDLGVTNIIHSSDAWQADAFYAVHGIEDADTLNKLRQRQAFFPSMVPAVPRSYVRISEGDEIVIGQHTWRAISGSGHSPEHMAFYSATQRLFISGDMVLPRISTNVSVWPTEPLANPLKLFLQSVRRYLDLPDDCLVLPSHGKPFYGLHTRVAQLLAHHEARLAEVQLACAQPAHAMTILQGMFRRKLDLHQTTFALGEALAHLHYLWYQKKVARRVDPAGQVSFMTIKDD